MKGAASKSPIAVVSSIITPNEKELFATLPQIHMVDSIGAHQILDFHRLYVDSFDDYYAQVNKGNDIGRENIQLILNRCVDADGSFNLKKINRLFGINVTKSEHEEIYKLANKTKKAELDPEGLRIGDVFSPHRIQTNFEGLFGNFVRRKIRKKDKETRFEIPKKFQDEIEHLHRHTPLLEKDGKVSGRILFDAIIDSQIRAALRGVHGITVPGTGEVDVIGDFKDWFDESLKRVERSLMRVNHGIFVASKRAAKQEYNKGNEEWLDSAINSTTERAMRIPTLSSCGGTQLFFQSLFADIVDMKEVQNDPATDYKSHCISRKKSKNPYSAIHQKDHIQEDERGGLVGRPLRVIKPISKGTADAYGVHKGRSNCFHSQGILDNEKFKKICDKLDLVLIGNNNDDIPDSATVRVGDRLTGTDQGMLRDNKACEVALRSSVVHIVASKEPEQHWLLLAQEHYDGLGGASAACMQEGVLASFQKACERYGQRCL